MKFLSWLFKFFKKKNDEDINNINIDNIDVKNELEDEIQDTKLKNNNEDIELEESATSDTLSFDEVDLYEEEFNNNENHNVEFSNIEINDLNSFVEEENYNDYGIKIGQTLFCTNGETVTVCEISSEFLIVEYKNNKYKRSLDVINKTLLLSNPINEKIDLHNLDKDISSKSNDIAKDKEDSALIAKKELNAQEEIEPIKELKEDIKLNKQKEVKLEDVKEKKLTEKNKTQINPNELIDDKFKPNETILYHNIYGEGRFIKLDSNKKFIYVRFNEGDKYAKFLYPSSINKLLFFNKTKEIIIREEKKDRVENNFKHIETKQKFKNKVKKDTLASKERDNTTLKQDLKINETVFFHENYGEGVFIGFYDKEKYIKIKFDNKEDIVKFVYPDSINKYIFFRKTTKMLKREKFLSNDKNKAEDIKEQKYFAKVKNFVDKYLRKAQDEATLIKYGANDDYEFLDSSLIKEKNNIRNEVNEWIDVSNNPYFARIDYENNKTVYIGKNKIDGLVIDWREKICNLYYNYNSYIGNNDRNLTLVRDFDITSGIYIGFTDKYSKKNNKKNITTSDEFLTKVIKSNRDDKNTHDIIRTIQNNQYQIITFDDSKSLVVLGCAGSGKTMIMLHRLSYMVFNNEQINMKNIYIISPNSLLNLESDRLSEELKLNEINRLPMNSFNIKLIKEYYSLNNTYNVNKFENILSNDFIKDDTIKNIYNEEFISLFKSKLIRITSLDTTQRDEFIQNESNILLNKYKVFCKKESEVLYLSSEELENELLDKYYKEIKDAVSKLPLQNSIEKIKSINNNLNSADNKDTTLEAKRDVLETLVNNWEMSNKTIYTKDNKISTADEMFNEVFSYFSVLYKGNKENKFIIKEFAYLEDKFDNTVQLINEYKDVIERLKRFEDFKLKKSLNYLSELINGLVYEIKNENKISLNHTYEFELFLHLVGCNLIFKELFYKTIHIFIDEFQDYSMTELVLYKEMFPNATFNLFGDYNQSINPKGLSEFEMNQVVGKEWNKFVINENYRNAYQITEYINLQFKLNMMPIGIKGAVNLIDIAPEEVQVKIRLSNSDRIALIVKDINLFDEIKSRIYTAKNKEINIIKDDNCSIKRGVLNVITIALAKGLEFEQVYVFKYKMTRNEEYVAYTRALNKLYVLE